MTQILVHEGTDAVPDPLGETRPGWPSASGQPAARGWAVVEIFGDGSLGLPHLVVAAGPVEAAATVPAAFEALAAAPEIPPAVAARLGGSHAADGRLHEARNVLTRGSLSAGPFAAPFGARPSCLGQLALVEAYLGDLRRAITHSALVLDDTGMGVGEGVAHAQVAMARVHLERGDLEECRRHLDLASAATQIGADPWLVTNRLLVEADLLVTAHQPDAAARLLAGALEVASPLSQSGWMSALLVTARADSLLAAGEPQRALAAVTPVPLGAVVEATVVAAAARREIGDVRGSDAVLRTVVQELDRAPLAVQVRALLLESRLAEDRGAHDRARRLLDRALQVAGPEEMSAPTVRERPWLRRFVDQDPSLLRAHRGLLASLGTEPVVGPAPVAGSDTLDHLVGAVLTEREGQVLDLLAQMYSTEEIAAALYVSANTVKTHLKGIFGKLCVNRRVDAVRRGRQLGLC